MVAIAKVFKITIDSSVRVCQLKELASDHSITRTAHIGNLNPTEMALVTLGVPFRLVDKNCSGIDAAYRPETRILDTREEILSCQQNVLSPYLRDATGLSLAHLHVSAASRCVPETRTSSYSMDYLDNMDLVRPVLEILARMAPQMFDRCVTGGGEVVQQLGVDDEFAYYGSEDLVDLKLARSELAQKACDYFAEVAEVLASGIPASGNGHVLLKAEADIILHAMIDTRSQSTIGVRRFYQCCGRAMARYIANPSNDKSAAIEVLYGKLRKYLPDLPPVEMVLLPVSNLRFAYLDKFALGIHQAILEVERRMAELKQKKAREIKLASNEKEREGAIARYQGLYRALQSRKSELVHELLDCKFHPFYELGSSQRMSQHDLLLSPERLLIPDDIMEMSLGSVSRRLKSLLSEHPQRKASIFT
jgi:hypothetical protein